MFRRFLSRWREIALLLTLGGILAGAALAALYLARRDVLELIGLLPCWRSAAVILFILGLMAAAVIVVYVSHSQARQWLCPPRNRVAFNPADQGLTDWEDVRFSTSDGLHIAAWFIRAENSDGAAVILVHGLGGNRGALIGDAALLNAQGYHTLLIDLRNHGDSDGTVMSLGYNEIEDVRAAVQYLLSRREVDASRIAALGHSLGAVTVVHAAAVIPEIRAVIAESTFRSIATSWRKIIRLYTGQPPAPLVPFFVDRLTGVPASQVDLMPDLDAIAPRPILFVHGSDDEVIDPEDSRIMYAAASGPKALYIVPGAGHTGMREADPEQYAERVVGFLNQYLRAF